ncbi:MAG: DUF3015 family protein [Nitrospiraceae bacterium]
MNIPVRATIRLFPIVALACTLSACTLKGTVKATTDPTTDILSSTSGKSWFTEEGLVKDEHKAIAFVHFNRENLKQDAARGQGEYLLSLGTLLGVKPDDQPRFVAFTQAQYPILFPSDRSSPSETLAVLTREWPGTRP